MTDSPDLLPPHGGYRKLKTFQLAQLVYDLTVRFCDRHVGRRSRTHDQMVQAARSGVQNIAEGSQASGTSRKTELKLTNVARASLEELGLDYEDFLRQRGLSRWPRDDARRQDLIDRRPRTVEDVVAWARDVRGRGGRGGRGGPGGRGGRSGRSGRGGRSGPSGRVGPVEPTHLPEPGQESTKSTRSTSSTYPEIAANGVLALIAVATALLDRQLAAQAKAFERDGGFTERLYRHRTRRRGKTR